MTGAALLEFLGAFPSFAGLAPGQLETLARHASEIEVERGRMLFRYGGSADRVYLIRNGRVALQIAAAHNDSLTLQTLAAGEVLGCSWLFPPYRWYFDALALETVQAVVLDARALRAECEADADLGYALMKCFSLVLHQRMQAARMQLIDLYGPTAETR